MQMANEKRLYRVVFDEIHKVISDINYREAFHFFPQLNGAGVSIFGPSASIPDHLIPSLCQLTKTTWKVIRTPSNRKELVYEVRKFPKNVDLREQVVDYWNKILPTYSAQDRCLIFCRSIDDTKKLGSLLGVHPFHSECEDDIPVQSFRGGQQQVLPTTIRLGCGFHYAQIRDVIHCDLGYSIIDQYQEDSRGGRDGKPCRAITFVNENRPRPVDKSLYDLGSQAVWEWSNKLDQCLRIIPSCFLDGVAVTCDLLPGAQLCAFCQQERRKCAPKNPPLLPVRPNLRNPPLTTTPHRASNHMQSPALPLSLRPQTPSIQAHSNSTASSPLFQTPLHKTNPSFTPQQPSQKRPHHQSFPSSSPLFQPPNKRSRNSFSDHSAEESPSTPQSPSKGDDPFIVPSFNTPVTPSTTNPQSSRTTPASMPRSSGRERPGFGPALAMQGTFGQQREWNETVNIPLHKVIELFREACIGCYFSANPSMYQSHRSEFCPISKNLMGYNQAFSAFRRAFNLPHGCCYGCGLTTKVCTLPFSLILTSCVILQSWGHHGSETGKQKCPDSGIIDRLLWVYWNMREPIFDLTGFEMVTDLETYILWLTLPYKLDGPGRWPNSQQVRYNYFMLIIALGEHYGWTE